MKKGSNILIKTYINGHSAETALGFKSENSAIDPPEKAIGRLLIF